MDTQIPEAYPDIPEASSTWGCIYACSNPVWDDYGEIALDDKPSLRLFSHQCRGANAPLYTVDGEVQANREAIADYVRGLYGIRDMA